jgi:hypothetical protein
MSHKVRDLRGMDSGRKRFAASLYTTPRTYAGQVRPRFYHPQDTATAVNVSSRTSLMGYSRELFATMGNLGGAIVQKNDWAFTDGWLPSFKGADQSWGDIAETWLTDKFFNVCNVRGSNFNFNTTLYLLGCALDVDGEALIVLTSSRDGFPLIQIVAAHRIGQRRSQEKTVTVGRYKGAQIIDGVIVNGNGRPVAYRILGDTEDDDYDISAQSAMLLTEPSWSDQYRGIPRLARVVLDALDTQDIDYYLKRTVKIESSQGIFHTTIAGTPDTSAPLVGLEEDTAPFVAPANTGLVFEALQGGEILYGKAGAGEKLESFKTDRPHSNTEAFVNRIERRCLYGLGWPIELLDPSKVGGASVRLIQSLARKSIRSRQNTVERAARFIVAWAVSRAMASEFIPANYQDAWYNFDFTRPASITVDDGNESKADIEGLKIGTHTLSEVTAKEGKDWYEVREQTQKETEDLLTRAQDLSKRYTISFDKALELLSQRGPNPMPNSAQDNNATI